MDLDRFVQDCVAAGRDADPQASVTEVMVRWLSAPRAMLEAVGEPNACGMNVIHSSPEITIINVVWAPSMTFMPHNHRTWAVIGLYAGREDNVFWRRTPGAIEAYGAKALFAGHVAALPVDVIHSVTNPLPRFSAGIHVYGGDFLSMERRQWNPETLVEEPNNSSISNAILAAAGGARDRAPLRED